MLIALLFYILIMVSFTQFTGSIKDQYKWRSGRVKQFVVNLAYDIRNARGRIPRPLIRDRPPLGFRAIMGRQLGRRYRVHTPMYNGRNQPSISKAAAIQGFITKYVKSQLRTTAYSFLYNL